MNVIQAQITRFGLIEFFLLNFQKKSEESERPQPSAIVEFSRNFYFKNFFFFRSFLSNQQVSSSYINIESLRSENLVCRLNGHKDKGD